MDESSRQKARSLRAEVTSGSLRGGRLWEFLHAVPAADRDLWVDELLGIEEAPPDSANLPRGSVPYLPCGVDEILSCVSEVPVGTNDTFVDIGAGLGRVAMLVHLLAGAKAHGIEIQAPLVERAEARREALALRDVSFERTDAARAALSGSVFFLYAPMNGPPLVEVLANLRALARTRSIVVCTVGLEFRDVEWLTARSTRNSAVAIYDSKSP